MAPSGKQAVDELDGLRLQLVVQLHLQEFTQLIDQCRDLTGVPPQVMCLDEIPPWSLVVPVNLQGGPGDVDCPRRITGLQSRAGQCVSYVDDGGGDLLLEEGLG